MVGQVYIAIVERGASAVECRPCNREEFEFESPLGIFVLFTMPQLTRLYK